MKTRLLVSVAVVSGVLVLAVGALGKTTQFSGPIKPSGTLSFKLTQKQDFTRLRNGFRFEALPLSCTGGKETTSGHLTFPVNVKRRHFVATAKARHGAASLVMKGKFKPGFKLARGTIEIQGKRVPLDSGGNGKCHSGLRHFKVEPQ